MKTPRSEEAPPRDRELELVAAIPLARGKELRIFTVAAPLGHFLHICEFEPAGRGGRMTPSRWGIHVGLEKLPAIRSALAEAEAAATAQGLLPVGISEAA